MSSNPIAAMGKNIMSSELMSDMKKLKNATLSRYAELEVKQ